MAAVTRLDTGFLVCTDDAILGRKCLTLSAALVQIEHPGGLALKIRVARKDPTAVRPRADRILCEPAPQGRLPDAGHESASDHLAANLRQAPARERAPQTDTAIRKPAL